jgi:hypothetical protein
MEERTCSKCERLKPVAEFPFRNKARGTYHSYCLACGRKFIKNHYEKNVQYYVKKAHARRKELLNEFNKNLYEYLEAHPCIDCGESDPVVLEFDHVRGEKSYNVSSLGTRLVSWNSVLKEIAKCEVRCANCHRRKTSERRGSYRHNRRYGPLAQFG